MLTLRLSRRRPLLTSLIVLVLALGVALNASLYTVMRSLETQPPPGIPRAEGLVRVRGTVTLRDAGGVFSRPMSGAEVAAIAERRDLFREVVYWTTDDVPVDLGDGAAVLHSAAFVSPRYFASLGVMPTDGRPWPAGTTDLHAVVSHRFWRSTGRASPVLVGTTIRINGRVVRIAGVMPERFVGPSPLDGQVEIWMPLESRGAVLSRSNGAGPDALPMSAVGVLQPGVSALQATRAVAAIASRVGSGTESPQARMISADVVPLRAANDTPGAATDASFVRVMSGAASLVLLIVCVTAGGLLVGAGIDRRREIAVRLSLGASRFRLARDLILETTVLALAGGAIGLGLLAGVLRVSRTMLTDVSIVIDWPAVALTVGISALAGVLAGVSPALHATRMSLAEALKGDSVAATPRMGLQRRLVILQIGLTQPLLVGLALLLLLQRSEPLGQLDPDVSERVSQVAFRTAGNAAASREDVAALQRAMNELPDIAGVVPHTNGHLLADLRRAASDTLGAAPDLVRSNGHYAAPDFFRLLDIPIVLGRTFGDGERDVVIVGSDFARRMWGNGNPIGRRLARTWRGSSDPVEVTVVGVVPERASILGVATVYVPAGMRHRNGLRVTRAAGGDSLFLVRTRGSPALLAQRLAGISPTVPAKWYFATSTSLADIERVQRSQTARVAGITAAAIALAVLLASVGLYALVALSVHQRRREIGIRMSLGARPAGIAWQVMGQGARLCLFGLVLGLPVAIGVLRVIGGAFSAPYVVMAGVVAAAVTIIVTLATVTPAYRAAVLDPAIVLRTD